MGVRIRLSRQTLAVLEALLVRPGEWHHGYSVSQQTGIPSGTLYPILMRLEKLHWLETEWEAAKTPGRPPRHLYRLTGAARSGRATNCARRPRGSSGSRQRVEPGHETRRTDASLRRRSTSFRGSAIRARDAGLRA